MNQTVVQFRGPMTGVPKGTRLNDTYEIDDLIAAGGMGEVYRGHLIETGDQVAIKMIKPELADNEAVLALFRKEASALNELHHDSIVRYYVFALDRRINRRFLAMEFVEGRALSDVLRSRALSLEEVNNLRKRVAAGLQVAHDKGIIHRDISPDNIILPEEDVRKAKIIDFGIARSTKMGAMTVIGDGFAGKYNYVSPEQLGLFGGEVTNRSDIYSLGLVMAECLLGTAIDMSGSQADVIDKRRQVPDLAGIPASIRPLIELMLQPKPMDRPESMNAIVDWTASQPRTAPPVEPAISVRPAVETGEPAKSRAPMAIAAGLAALVAGAGGGWWLMRPTDPPAPPSPRPTPVVVAPIPAPTPAPTPIPVAPPIPSQPEQRASPLVPEPPLRPESATGPQPGPLAPDPPLRPESMTGPPPGPPDTTPTPVPVLPTVPTPPPVPIPVIPPIQLPVVTTPPAPAPTPPAPAVSSLDPARRAPGPLSVAEQTARILNYVRYYDGGACLFLQPLAVTNRSASIEAIGTTGATFAAFEADFREVNGFPVNLQAGRISQPQCEIVSFLHRVDAEPDLSVRTEIRQNRIRAGTRLHASFLGTGERVVEVLVLNEDGTLRSVTSLVKREAGALVLDARIDDQDRIPPQQKVLFSIVSPRRIEALSGVGRLPTNQVLAAIAEEIERGKLKVSLVSRLVRFD